jgi:spore germination protein KB
LTLKLSTNRLEALPFSEVKISPVQLAFLQIGFLFGSSAINNPATAARQDAWLAFLVGWAGGALLIGIYILISRLNPGMTLVDILLPCFGKIAGTILSLFYIWYFIHLASLVIRNFGDYMKTINYPQTPLLIIAVALTAVAAYSVRKGLESTGRTSEVLVPLLPLSVILIFLYVFNEYKPGQLPSYHGKRAEAGAAGRA